MVYYYNAAASQSDTPIVTMHCSNFAATVLMVASQNLGQKPPPNKDYRKISVKSAGSVAGLMLINTAAPNR